MSGPDWVPTLKHLDGKVTDPVPPMGVYLYIDLEKGRRLNFFVSSPDGTVTKMSGGTFP